MAQWIVSLSRYQLIVSLNDTKGPWCFIEQEPYPS